MMVIHAVNLALIVLVTVIAAAVPPSSSTEVTKPQIDLNEVLTRMEDRLRGLEVAWARVDLRLQQDSNNLHSKIDRLERSINSRALHAKMAAERAANACQKLQQKMIQDDGVATKGMESPKGIDNSQRQQQQQQQTTMQQDVANVIAKEATVFTAKVSNMYNDLWRRSLTLEGLMKESMILTNSSRKDVQEGLKSVTQTVRRVVPASASQCNLAVQAVDHMNNVIQRKMTESNHKLDTKFQEVSLAQNLFLESCHRIQLKESQLENEIARVLQKLLDSFMNKTSSTYREMQMIQEMIKSHDSHIIKAVARVHNAAKEQKTLTNSIYEECRREDGNNKRIDNISSFNKKLDNLLTNLQEMQDKYEYTESRRTAEVVKSFDAKNILEKIVTEIRNAVSNITSSPDYMVMCRDKMKDNERDSLIEKLTHLVTTMQNLAEEKFFENEENEVEPTETSDSSTKSTGKLNSEKFAEFDFQENIDDPIMEYENIGKGVSANNHFKYKDIGPNLRSIEDTLDDYTNNNNHKIHKRHPQDKSNKKHKASVEWKKNNYYEHYHRSAKSKNFYDYDDNF